MLKGITSLQCQKGQQSKMSEKGTSPTASRRRWHTTKKEGKLDGMGGLGSPYRRRVLSSVLQNVVLFGNRVVGDNNSLKWGDTGVSWALHPLWLESFCEEERDTERRMPCEDRDTHRHRGKCEHVEAETRVTLPQAKACLGLREAGRDSERSPAAPKEAQRFHREVWPGQHLNFGLLASRSVRKHISVI